MKNLAFLFTRVRTLLGQKPREVLVATPQLREVPHADPVAQAYVQFGPRVARHVARAARAKAAREEPSRQMPWGVRLAPLV